MLVVAKPDYLQLHRLPTLFSVTSEHIRFLLVSFSVSDFLVVGSVR